MILGCYWDNCSGSGPFHDNYSSIRLDLVSKFDSISILYVSQGNHGDKIPIRERIEEGLQDTVRVVFYGLERFYERRIRNQVVLKENTVEVKHFAQDSVRVIYGDTSRGIQVLEKTACTPAMAGFVPDSILVSHASMLKVKTTGKTE